MQLVMAGRLVFLLRNKLVCGSSGHCGRANAIVRKFAC